MSDSPYIFDIDQSNFNELVIEKSKETLVVVDFWADWCQPCQMLMPILSKLAEEYAGGFILAKVNSDAQQELAAQNGVRSLPTVKFFKDGQAVDEFMGAQPEPAIRQLLEKYVVTEMDLAIKAAIETAENGNAGEALESLKALNKQDPSNPKIHIAIARTYMLDEQYEAADELLRALPVNIQTSDEVSAMMSEIDFALTSKNAPALDELKASLDSDPDNSEARFQLASQQLMMREYESALENFLYILIHDREFKDGGAQKSMLKIFELLGPRDELVKRYRQKMSSALY